MLLKFIFYLCCILCFTSFLGYCGGIKKEKEVSNSTTILFYVFILSLSYILAYLF